MEVARFPAVAEKNDSRADLRQGITENLYIQGHLKSFGTN